MASLSPPGDERPVNRGDLPAPMMLFPLLSAAFLSPPSTLPPGNPILVGELCSAVCMCECSCLSSLLLYASAPSSASPSPRTHRTTRTVSEISMFPTVTPPLLLLLLFRGE